LSTGFNSSSSSMSDAIFSSIALDATRMFLAFSETSIVLVVGSYFGSGFVPYTLLGFNRRNTMRCILAASLPMSTASGPISTSDSCGSISLNNMLYMNNASFEMGRSMTTVNRPFLKNRLGISNRQGFYHIVIGRFKPILQRFRAQEHDVFKSTVFTPPMCSFLGDLSHSWLSTIQPRKTG
uniref:Secreted protein n=1 Tax=Haemonchus placei TaxID=6290 RepID=A0A0N4W402_HAEPC